MPDAKDDLRAIDWGPGSPVDEGLTGLDPVVAEAKRNFTRGMKWEAQARTRWINDLKFANADSDGSGEIDYSEWQIATINKYAIL